MYVLVHTYSATDRKGSSRAKLERDARFQEVMDVSDSIFVCVHFCSSFVCSSKYSIHTNQARKILVLVQ